MQSAFLPQGLTDVYGDLPLQSLNIFLSGVTMGDDRFSDAMAATLAANGYSFEYVKVNEGHSWGAWRGQLDDVLMTMLGDKPIPEPTSVTLLAVGGPVRCPVARA